MSSNIDQSLLTSNLELSPTERLEQHQHALDLLLEIDKAKDLLIVEELEEIKKK